MRQLRVILGDQLTEDLPIFTDKTAKKDCIFLCETRSEWTVVKHHKKKIAFQIAARRHFAAALEKQGYGVHYIRLDDPCNTHTLTQEVARRLDDESFSRLVITEPSEYHVLQEVKGWQAQFEIPVDILDDTRFLSTHDEFKEWAQHRKQLTMEFFYRAMRKKHGILMEGASPVGGEWNYDKENRQRPSEGVDIPLPFIQQPDRITQEAIALTTTHFSDHFGDMEPFYFAVTREQALDALAQFIERRLPLFGTFQDAMLQDEPWLYHSHLSFYLNCGLLQPLECIQAAEVAYVKEQAPINAVEGFIRQILGWREYIRGIYWLKMPQYETANFLNAKRPLPEFFWTAQTQMNCLAQCIFETQRNAYAHHIQRLMVIGNFALLSGLHPDEVNEWYWIVYADAYQWVELPNVTGMILYADGGCVATKPYAASGAYINKMSNYCKGCKYSVTQKNGDNACPFNYLFWHFLIENQEVLKDNPRLRMAYQTLSKMSDDKVRLIKKDAHKFLQSL